MMHKLIDGILSYTHDIDTNERENRGQWMRERVKWKSEGKSDSGSVEDGKGPIRTVTAERVRL